MVEIQTQRLGVKRFGGEQVRAGNILLRQSGMKFSQVQMLGVVKILLLFALDGTVKFDQKMESINV
jgi:large subunit ribosomal protein L27